MSRLLVCNLLEESLLEIEGKYTASESQFSDLLEIHALGEYKLEDIGEQTFTDHYMDTSQRHIGKAGYACRIREKSSGWLLTVKGLGGADGAIHQREEYEAEIPRNSSPEQWFCSPARELVTSLIHSHPLVELCTIHQHRITRTVYKERRCVGEMSLDVVDMKSIRQPERIYEVEIELQQDGILEDLHALGEILQSRGLCPEKRSKFERAMTRLGEAQGGSGS